MKQKRSNVPRMRMLLAEFPQFVNQARCRVCILRRMFGLHFENDNGLLLTKRAEADERGAFDRRMLVEDRFDLHWQPQA